MSWWLDHQNNLGPQYKEYIFKNLTLIWALLALFFSPFLWLGSIPTSRGLKISPAILPKFLIKADITLWAFQRMMTFCLWIYAVKGFSWGKCVTVGMLYNYSHCHWGETTPEFACVTCSLGLITLSFKHLLGSDYNAQWLKHFSVRNYCNGQWMRNIGWDAPWLQSTCDVGLLWCCCEA